MAARHSGRQWCRLNCNSSTTAVVIVLHLKNSDCWRPLAAEGSSVYTCVQRVLRVHMCTHDSSQTAPPSGSPPYTHVYSTHGTHDSSQTAPPSGSPPYTHMCTVHMVHMTHPKQRPPSRSPPCTHVYKRSSPYTCVLGFSELLILNSNP